MILYLVWVSSKSKKDRKCNEQCFKIGKTTAKHRIQKWGQFWKQLGVLSWDALGARALGEGFPRGLGKGLWKEMFVLLRSELWVYTP